VGKICGCSRKWNLGRSHKRVRHSKLVMLLGAERRVGECGVHKHMPDAFVCNWRQMLICSPKTLQSPLLCRLTPRLSQCQPTLTPRRSGQRVSKALTKCSGPEHLVSACANSSKPATPHRIARAYSVSNARTLRLTWTPSLSPDISVSPSATSSTVATSALLQLPPWRNWQQYARPGQHLLSWSSLPGQ
jgi:hypothetical protein